MSPDSAVMPGRRTWHEMAESGPSGRDHHAGRSPRHSNGPDHEVLTILDAAFRVRRQYFQDSVQLYYSRMPKVACAGKTALIVRSPKSQTLPSNAMPS